MTTSTISEPAPGADQDAPPRRKPRTNWREVGLATALILPVLLSSFQVFDLINVMTRGGPLGTGTMTMIFQVYEETFNNSRAGYGAAIATIMFTVVLIITVIQVRVQDRQD